MKTLLKLSAIGVLAFFASPALAGKQDAVDGCIDGVRAQVGGGGQVLAADKMGNDWYVHLEDASGGETVVRIDGWLEGDEEAAEVLRVVRGATRPVALDLAELQSSDLCGLETLQTLEHEGCALRGTSDFIRLLLDEVVRRSDRFT